jgi:DNA-binding SARP family transcriptional activator
MPMITVRLLGSVDICDAGGNELETLVRQPKRVALLSYLAAAVPRGFHRRDTLMGLFWPESTQDQARHALSQALHVLRQEMGEAAIVTRGEGEVALSEDAVSVDVWALETALAAGDLDSVVSLYRGALLSGFAVKASAEFDQWLDAARDRLARAYADSLERLAEAATQRGARREAVAWWRRLAEHDPYRTHVTLGLMRAFEAAGDRAGALEQAERHTELLRSEFAAEPPPDVVTYAERLRSEPLQSADEPLSQLEALPTPSRAITPTPVDRVAKRRWMMAGAAAAAAVIIAVIAAVTSVPRGVRVTLDPERVLVAVFENHTGDASLDPLGPMAGHWITQGLQKSAVAQVVPWMEAQRASQYVAAEAAAGNVRNRVMALAEETGAGTVISGAYYRRGETVQYQVEVTDVTRGHSLGVLDPAIAPLDSPDDAIEPMRQRVMGLLAISFDERLATAGRGAIGPPTLAAYQAFDDGLRLYLMSAHDADAIPHFYRAFALDTSFAMPLFYATLVHSNIGQWREADSLVGIVARSRDRLSDYDQHWLDYLRAELDGDNPAALRAIRRAAELAPGSKAVYNRARQALHSNRPQEAVDALLTLDPERGPMRGWRPYFEQLIGAYSALDEHERALEAAQQYRKTYGDDLATLVRVRRRSQRAARRPDGLVRTGTEPGRCDSGYRAGPAPPRAQGCCANHRKPCNTVVRRHAAGDEIERSMALVLCLGAVRR